MPRKPQHPARGIENLRSFALPPSLNTGVGRGEGPRRTVLFPARPRRLRLRTAVSPALRPGPTRDMVLSELAARLNCAEYKNWVKAGHCLLLLRGCLQGFVGREVLAFHHGLLAAAPSLGPRATCRSGSRCSPRARHVSTWPEALTTASRSHPRSSAVSRVLTGSVPIATPGAETPPVSSGPYLTAALCSFSLSVRCAQSGNRRF